MHIATRFDPAAINERDFSERAAAANAWERRSNGEICHIENKRALLATSIFPISQ
jgi:hypothetical protein